mgnify:CR=1 FL=1
MIDRVPLGNVTVSDWLMVFEMVNAPQNSKLPPEAESKIPNALTAPQLPLGVGNVIDALFEVVPVLPLDAVVVPAP